MCVCVCVCVCVYIYAEPSTRYSTTAGLMAHSAEGRGGREVVLASGDGAIEVVSKNGMCLQHAPLELRADKKVILAALFWGGSLLCILQ
jgi:hypothetical protein